MFKNTLRLLRLPDITGIESLVGKIFLDERNMVIGAFYRPPNSDKYLVPSPFPPTAAIVHSNWTIYELFHCCPEGCLNCC